MQTYKTTVLRNKNVDLVMYDLFKAADKKHKLLVQNLISRNNQIKIVDEIESQLIELVKINFPKERFNSASALVRALQWKKITDLSDYGNWVHYPWLNTLVHILPEKEFISVRTSRNNYKITPEEQKTLSTKKVGVIGLSVGQSISLTMALERIFGEIRIADFDDLELSNLNRIRSGVHNLGLPKVAMVAREIAEIDPYLKVTCFWDGITDKNIDQFLTADGNLDLVADECDEIHIKFLLREKAKKHSIPVLMDTSDRGMLDIERFDLEPDRKIFHGKVEHLDPEGAKHLKTNEEKVTYALPIVGIESASSRIKASMMEIGETISTWPQLSSDVALGGAISTNVIRRIFLDQHTTSGRFYADMAELFKGTSTNDQANYSPPELPAITEADMLYDVMDLNLLTGRVRANPEEEKTILESAIRAPSGANCQPWKWLVTNQAYFLFHDKHFSSSFNDFEDTGSHLTMGCAVESFMRAADDRGFNVHVLKLPFGADHRLKAIIQLGSNGQVLDQNLLIKPSFPELNQFLLKRKTNRNLAERKEIPKNQLELLKEVTAANGAELKLITQPDDIKKLGKLIAICDKIRVLHPQCHYELFKKELRKTKEENEKFRDGIDMELMDLSASDKIALAVASDQKVIAHLNSWEKGNGFTKISEKSIKTASALGIITMKSHTALDFFNGGMATQCMWLAATQLNLAVQPMTVLPYFFHRLHAGNGVGFKEADIKTLKTLWNDFNKIVPSTQDQGLVFLFKLAIAGEPAKLSLRKKYHELTCIK